MHSINHFTQLCHVSVINRKQELCCTHLLCPSVLLYIHCLSCNMFLTCPYMMTVVMSISLVSEDVTALVSVNKQFKKIHQIIGYNSVSLYLIHLPVG